ncbi:hypothetical protein N3K66_008202 [Trichothecium roseum]|uniref:Uncharacterized protein n=1 Tax=Trichothecium roseum TaxID=47278 RepID=A0ACC0UTY0_9HYPO|nr:hypothetical protein N3K66_008202 [Trichothecium roseum]
MASSSSSPSKQRHRHSHNHKQHPPQPISLTHLALTTLLFLATLSNFLLAVLSTAAWTSSRHRRRAASSPSPSPYPEGCLRSARRLGHVYCGFTRWGLFLFLSVGALLCAAATATMTIRMLGRDAAARHRRNDGGRNGYVLRGALFTVCVYAPLIYLGWADVTVVGPALAGAGAGGGGGVSPGGGDNSSSAAAGAMVGIESIEPWDLGKGGTLLGTAETPRVVFFEGITGAFILQSMDAGVPTADAAMMAAHLCLFFALLITGIAAATDRSFPVKVGDAEKATGQATPST